MKNVFSSMFKVVRLYRWQEIIGLVFTILYTIGVSLTPIVSKYLIDKVIPSNSIESLKIGILIFFLGCMGQPLFGYLKNIVFMKISENITIFFRERMFNKVIDAPLEFFDKSSVGGIVSRISNDGRSISEFITNFFVIVIKNVVQIIIFIAAMLWLSKEITIMVIIFYGLYFFVNWFISKSFTKLSREKQLSYDNICIKINRSASLISTIKAFNQEERIKDEFKNIIENNYNNNIKYRRRNLFINSLSNTIMIMSLSAVYGIGSLMVMDGRLTIGTVVAIGLYFQSLIQPVFELLNSNIDIHSIAPIFERIDEYCNLDTERKISKKEAISKLESLELKNVNFKYKDGVNALEDISIRFPSKGIFAVVGDSGAGKSSLIKLISALYDSYDGEIRINGNEYKEYAAKDIRNNISLVSQDIELTQDSIKNNIKMNRAIDDKEIEEVLRKLNLSSTIEKLNLGINTIINERINLSGGEKQRISIARALMKNSLIYIFDEPTAALDTINEKIVKDILEELCRDRLVIIITHNLSLLNRADKIYTMKDGKIIEEGNYKYLSENETYFSKLMKELT